MNGGMARAILQLQGERSPGMPYAGHCKAYHAMTTFRPYRRVFTQEEAVAELRRQAGRQFDPVLVEEFIAMLAARQTNFTAAEEDAVAFKELNQEQN